tara:strand:+ start:4727 stop:4888 length:162 start_codon:yes stop_codon:yes gene_type:complete
MFEECPMINNRKCGFAGYDKNKELRCGLATFPNKVRELSLCPREKLKKRKYKR